MDKFLISTKDEMYTFDELNIIYETLDSSKSVVKEKLQKILKVLEPNKKSMALFFMPQNTFDIFSMFQGDNSICNIEYDDVQQMFLSCDENKSVCSLEVTEHLKKKLKILYEYLKSSNKVKPVIIVADNFSYL